MQVFDKHSTALTVLKDIHYMISEYLAECPFGKFGKDCNGTCDCSNDVTCDVINGKCSEKEHPNSDGDINESKGTVMIYIMMAAAVIGLVCVVTMTLKAKEALCRKVQKPKKDTTKRKIKRRKAQRIIINPQRKSSDWIVYNRNNTIRGEAHIGTSSSSGIRQTSYDSIIHLAVGMMKASYNKEEYYSFEEMSLSVMNDFVDPLLYKALCWLTDAELFRKGIDATEIELRAR
ncbi:unnamed protein product [Mytilus coruscus]|uniref:Uncharacterized protein n=1 Tax=Mytilus coruscus TaxID=42192 RepID=A0A6J8CNJ6_MYTCO|nr:unnamed protein product [Mytilus coruscus]